MSSFHWDQLYKYNFFNNVKHMPKLQKLTLSVWYFKLCISLRNLRSRSRSVLGYHLLFLQKLPKLGVPSPDLLWKNGIFKKHLQTACTNFRFELSFYSMIVCWRFRRSSYCASCTYSKPELQLSLFSKI